MCVLSEVVQNQNFSYWPIAVAGTEKHLKNFPLH